MIFTAADHLPISSNPVYFAIISHGHDDGLGREHTLSTVCIVVPVSVTGFFTFLSVILLSVAALFGAPSPNELIPDYFFRGMPVFEIWIEDMVPRYLFCGKCSFHADKSGRHVSPLRDTHKHSKSTDKLCTLTKH